MTEQQQQQRLNSKGSSLSFKEGFVYLLIGLGSSWILARWEGLALSSKIVAQTASTSTRYSSIPATIPRPQFIFTMAMLGGDASLHATLGKSIEQTAAMDTLTAIGATPLLVQLHKLLYQKIGDDNMSPGLWNAHCAVQVTKADSAQLHDQVVRLLKQIDALIQDAYTKDQADAIIPIINMEPILPIPINTVLWKSDRNSTAIENRFGYATYPTQFFGVSCHRNDFPSLDLLYAACQEANVDCRHVYVHRPPLWELKQIMRARIQAFQKSQKPRRNSTGHAVYLQFGNHLAVLHLWNTMLHVMADELVRFAPRGLGCIHAQNYQQVWNDIWGGAPLPKTLFPFTGQDNEQGDIPRSELDSVLPLSAAPYVESYLQLFEATNQACEDSYQKLQDFFVQLHGQHSS